MGEALHWANREHYVNGVKEMMKMEMDTKKHKSVVSRNPFQYSIQTEPWLRCKEINYTTTKKNVLGNCEQNAPNCHIGNSGCAEDYTFNQTALCLLQNCRRGYPYPGGA